MSAPSPRSPRNADATRRAWVDRLARYCSYGQTVARFCAAEGVSVPAFYQWKRALAAGDTPVPASGPPTFIPLRVAPANASAVELVLPSGAILRFPAGTDPATIAAYQKALANDHHLGRDQGIDAALQKFDLDALVAPTNPVAWKIDLLDGDHDLGGSSTPTSLAGYPAINVPAGFTSDGLPIGVQLMGPANSEGMLISLAAELEAVCGWASEQPEVWWND